MIMNLHLARTIVSVALLTPSVSLFAGSPPPPVTTGSAEEPSAFDKLWALTTLYKNKDNPFIQELKLRGRYQGQAHWLDSEQEDDDDWENRRARFGINAKFFDRKLDLQLDAQSNDEFDPVYNELVDAFLKWKINEDFSLTVGKQKPYLAHYDWVQSTNTQPTFERSQIFNQLRVNRATGALLEATPGGWRWQAGVYSNDMDREFGQFAAGWSFGAGLGYDFKESFSAERAELRLDWLRRESDPADTVLNRYENIVTGTFHLEDTRWSLVTELFFARGEAPTAFGGFIQGTYDLLPDKLQLVGRYSLGLSDDPDGLTAQARYERTAPALTGGGRGDRYHAAYLGLQYFIYGDKLKLLAGAEYSHLDGGGNGGDFDGLTLLSGIRFSF
jgi:phosphate-selective porin OprO and OprP